MKSFAIALALYFFATSAALAEPMLESDIPFRYLSLHVSYDVNADGSYVETQRWSRTVLKENALESFKNASITFSTSVAKGEILEAYTLKKTGQRLDVPSSSYQVSIEDGYQNASPLYSDETTISVVFPDLAVGDTMVFASRVTNKVGMFPNQFSTVEQYSRFIAFDDIVIEIAAPAAMKLKSQSYFFTAQKPVVKDGKQILRWTYRNKTPEKRTPSDEGITIPGDQPSLFVSTYKSYREIAESYGVRATPKAAVTERIKALAGEIVGDKTTPATQATALYDWVAKNISYGGNCIGIGAVVPRDLDVVLDNKQGDCKDHATLLQALLAARNIESEQALVNAGNLFQLPDVPVVSAVNHVINYISGLNIYVDATSSATPFGMLPPQLGEKPVLLVSHYRDGQKIPSTAQYGHEEIVRTQIRINADGTASGKTEVSLKGLPAIAARQVMRNLPREQEEYVAKKLLESQGNHGTAVLQKDDPTALLDTYHFAISYQLEDYLPVGTATGMPVRPVVQTFFPVSMFVRDVYAPLPKKPQMCSGGKSSEEYRMEFPASVKLVSFPKNVEIAADVLDYKATYELSSDNVLTVRRTFNDKTATNVCSPEYDAAYRKSLASVVKDLKSQVLLGE